MSETWCLRGWYAWYTWLCLLQEGDDPYLHGHHVIDLPETRKQVHVRSCIRPKIQPSANLHAVTWSESKIFGHINYGSSRNMYGALLFIDYFVPILGVPGGPDEYHAIFETQKKRRRKKEK